MSGRARVLRVVLLALLAAAAAWRLSQRGDGGGSSSPPPASAPSDAPVPGGSLRAHEGLDGAHTIARHVGLSEEDLRTRLSTDGLREASTFPDLAGADRAVGEVLRRRRAEVAAWLAGDPRGAEAFTATLEEPAGRVLRVGDGASRPGRTVKVILVPDRRFREGFHVQTAYVRLP